MQTMSDKIFKKIPSNSISSGSFRYLKSVNVPSSATMYFIFTSYNLKSFKHLIFNPVSENIFSNKKIKTSFCFNPEDGKPYSATVWIQKKFLKDIYISGIVSKCIQFSNSLTLHMEKAPNFVFKFKAYSSWKLKEKEV